MANNFVAADFTAAPSDELITQDIYQITEAVAINKPGLGEVANDLVSALMDTIKDTNGFVNSAVEKTQSIKPLTANQLNSMIGDATGFSPTTTSLFLALLKNDNSALMDILGLSEYSDADLILDQQRQRLNRIDFSSATAITAMLASLTNNQSIATIISRSNEAQIFTAILKIAIAAGVPQLIDAALAKIEDNKIKRRILIDSLETAVARCDFGTIDKIINETSLESVLKRMPDIILRLLNNYRFKQGTKTVNHDALRTELLNFISRFDANWDKISRNGQNVSSLLPFIYASRDATVLLSLPDGNNPSIYLQQLSLARRYPTMDLWALGRNLYGRDLIA